MTYLEAARYKVHSTLAELNGDRRGSHPLASHIQVTRDRQGLQQSVLKVRKQFYIFVLSIILMNFLSGSTLGQGREH